MTTTPVRKTAEEIAALSEAEVAEYFAAGGDLSAVLAKGVTGTPPSGPVPTELPVVDENGLALTSVRIPLGALRRLDEIGGRDGRSALIRQAVEEYLQRHAGEAA